jgi:hypothetical protein
MAGLLLQLVISGRKGFRVAFPVISCLFFFLYHGTVPFLLFSFDLFGGFRVEDLVSSCLLFLGLWHFRPDFMGGIFF